MFVFLCLSVVSIQVKQLLLTKVKCVPLSLPNPTLQNCMAGSLGPSGSLEPESQEAE